MPKIKPALQIGSGNSGSETACILWCAHMRSKFTTGYVVALFALVSFVDPLPLPFSTFMALYDPNMIAPFGKLAQGFP